MGSGSHQLISTTVSVQSLGASVIPPSPLAYSLPSLTQYSGFPPLPPLDRSAWCTPARISGWFQGFTHLNCEQSRMHTSIQLLGVNESGILIEMDDMSNPHDCRRGLLFRRSNFRGLPSSHWATTRWSCSLLSCPAIEGAFLLLFWTVTNTLIHRYSIG